jgi:hypothetical protein
MANFGQRLFLRLSRRVKRLGHRVPLVIPAPEAAVQDPAIADAAGATLFTKCSSADQYESYVAEHARLFASRAAFETRLIPSFEYFRVRGYCAACKRETDFLGDFLYARVGKDGKRIPNWRERLVCRRCKLPNRVRATIDFMEHVLTLDRFDTIYVTEQASPFHGFLKRRYPNTSGSEFMHDGTAQGKSNWLGIKNEDLTNLSLRDSSVNIIVTTDVLEHVPDYTKAISECFRVLKSDGALIVSVPFVLASRETLVRARVNADGSIEHLLTPEYHGDGVNTRGVLCYYHFGWDLLDSLRRAGFSDTALYFYWSSRRGYLGGSQFLICAKKPPPAQAPSRFTTVDPS